MRLKPAWIGHFNFQNVDLFPRLFPRFAFDTPVLEREFQRVSEIGGTQ